MAKTYAQLRNVEVDYEYQQVRIQISLEDQNMLYF